LERSRARDRARRFTSAGPHRDDLRLHLDRDDGPAMDLRTYGSGGEQRTAAIALRLTEAAWLREALGREPIALLDDVFGELDHGRVRGILEWLGIRGTGQVILTAPAPVDLAVVGRELAPLVVEGGRIRSAVGAVP
ncbi:MAG: DNA replication/repair protein RecF, partial [Gemmatimonadota bacterium]